MLILRTRWPAWVLFVFCVWGLAAPELAQTRGNFVSRFLNRNNPEVSDKQVFIEDILPANHTRLIGGAVDASVYTGGIEYIIHYHNRPWYHYLDPLSVSWDVFGAVMHARVDSTFELLPVAILNEPLRTDVWGDDLSVGQKQQIYGLAYNPIGYQLTWFAQKPVRMFWNSRVGGEVYAKKALSPTASYANFDFGTEIGTQVRLTEKMDFRLGATFYHFSNGYFAKSNPGMDEAGPDFGIVYRIPRKQVLPFRFHAAGR